MDVDKKEVKNTRKLKYGWGAAAITVLFVAAVVLLNITVSLITKNFPLKADLTSNKMYEISQETRDYLNNLNTDVEIAVMADETSFKAVPNNKSVAEVLEKYAVLTGHIKLKYLNPNSNPTEYDRYNSLYTGGVIEENMVVITAGNKIRVHPTTDFYTMQYVDYTSEYPSVVGFKAEQIVTSGLMYVTDANPQKAAFVMSTRTAANNSALQSLSYFLALNGYEMDNKEVNLDIEDITDDVDLLVLYAPMSDLTDTAIDKIEQFMDNDGKYGKNMLYAASLDQELTPNLDAYIEEWGFKLGRSLVLEDDEAKRQTVGLSAIGSQTSASVGYIDNTDYITDLPNVNIPIIVAYSRPIEILWDSMSGRTAYSLLKTSPTSYLYPTQEEETQEEETASSTSETAETTAQSETEESETEAETTVFDSAGAPKSEQVVAAVCQKTKSGTDSQVYTGSVMVLGSALFTDYSLMSSNACNNAAYIISAINTMTGKDTSFLVSEKAFEDKSIVITKSEIKALGFVVMGVIPIIVILLGVFVYIRRRNR
ncbi:MAG: GldG family protein [Oscillospiraceae bacterium]|jgi:ABC-type uncharacterized transport system involved in gliding motility auxiliary subunit|nr:GldG family protein [Oscillospiraceae bacterium]